MKWPLVFLAVAAAAVIVGFSGVSETYADAGIMVFLVAGALFVVSLVFGKGLRSGVLGGAAGVAILAGAAVTAVWFSDRYSLESAGAGLDQTLADARQTLDEVVADLPHVNEGVGDAVDSARDVFTPEQRDALEDGDPDDRAFDPNPGAAPMQGAD